MISMKSSHLCGLALWATAPARKGAYVISLIVFISKNISVFGKKFLILR